MKFAVVCTYVPLYYLAPKQELPYPIVHIAVGEHGIDVLYALKGLSVISVLETLLNSAQVHRFCNNCIIILKGNKGNRIIAQTSFLLRLQLMEVKQ